MADETTQAIFDAMEGDSLLQSLLPQFRGRINVHTGKTIPPDAPRPYIWSWGDITNLPFDTKDIIGREVTRDIWIVADDTGSEVEVMDIANRVRDLFNRLVMTIGAANLVTIVNGPRVGASTEDLTARIVTVDFTYQFS